MKCIYATIAIVSIFMQTSCVSKTKIKQSSENPPSKTLFDTTSIGNLRMKNRFIRASVGDSAPGGVVNMAMLKRYYHLAQGGVGTIITGYTLVDGDEKEMGIMGMYHDSFIAGTGN
ncbi:MAG: hypothetical protein K2I90_11585 [Odoribacter sp.]|nr:hypothetical protein [Odoribacter sp.]